MTTLWMAVIPFTLLGLFLGLILGYASRRFKAQEEQIVDLIDALLPQSQCGQCGFPGCRPYAQAIADRGAKINLCAPGGEGVMVKIADTLNVEPQRIDGGASAVTPVRMQAIIDEMYCIGCNKCFQACPVDAIVGATRTLHTVISDRCTGCDLCVDPCPTRCITLRPVGLTTESGKWDLRTIPVDTHV